VEKRRGWGWAVIGAAMEEDLAWHLLDLAWASGDGAEAAGRSRGSSAVPCCRREK
jgi:hypothetical protein